ncbi:hypothetical protein D3C73_1261670 [compost metagenome]
MYRQLVDQIGGQADITGFHGHFGITGGNHQLSSLLNQRRQNVDAADIHGKIQPFRHRREAGFHLLRLDRQAGLQLEGIRSDYPRLVVEEMLLHPRQRGLFGSRNLLQRVHHISCGDDAVQPLGGYGFMDIPDHQLAHQLLLKRRLQQDAQIRVQREDNPPFLLFKAGRKPRLDSR